MQKPPFLKKIIFVTSSISLILFSNMNSTYCAPGDMKEVLKHTGWAPSKGVFGALSGSLEDVCRHIARGAALGLGVAIASRIYYYINGPYLPTTHTGGPE